MPSLDGILDNLQYVCHRYCGCEPAEQQRSCRCGAWVYQRLKANAASLKSQLPILHYARLDEQTRCFARFIITLAVGFALSPIDLIPDFIPLLGPVDDLLLQPSLLYIAYITTPQPVLERAQLRAESEPVILPASHLGAAMVGIIWCVGLISPLIGGIPSCI